MTYRERRSRVQKRLYCSAKISKYCNRPMNFYELSSISLKFLLTSSFLLEPRLTNNVKTRTIHVRVENIIEFDFKKYNFLNPWKQCVTVKTFFQTKNRFADDLNPNRFTHYHMSPDLYVFAYCYWAYAIIWEKNCGQLIQYKVHKKKYLYFVNCAKKIPIYLVLTLLLLILGKNIFE